MEYVAEIGWNFMGDLDLARKMISEASFSGATTAKFQYWNPTKLKQGEWDKDGRRQIYEKAKLNEQKIKELHNLCQKNKLDFMVSVFNREDAEFIGNISKKNIKIPSHEVNNLDLINYCLENFEKVYISLGACSEIELNNAVSLINKKRKGDKNVIAMHCVSSYPCNVDRVNLNRLDVLASKLNNTLGISDHSTSELVPAFAVMKGAKVIEKHFTVDNDLPGRDNKFAILPDGFKNLVFNCEEAKKSLINHGVDAQDIEMDTINIYRGRWG